MRVLLIEDEDDYIEIFQLELGEPLFTLTVASSRSSAMVALEQSYELVVCDLRIPSDDGGLDFDTAHGMAVLAAVVNSFPGTPIIAFSAYGTVPVLQELLKSGRHGDYLGIGHQDELVTFLEKDQLPECLARVNELRQSMSQLQDIEISTGGHSVSLSVDDERVIRLFVRRAGGTLVHLRPLNGGLSSSRVFHLRVENTAGHVATVVGKIDLLEKVQNERRIVETYIVGALPPGSFPAVASIIEVGAAATGGLFYQAAGFEQSLSDQVSSNPQTAAQAVQTIAENLARWREGSTTQRQTVGDLRRAVLPDHELNPLQLDNIDAEAESVSVHIKSCVQHADLHVFNVLVSDDGVPIVIDFQDVRIAPASLDAVTLELSILVHESRRGLSDWPTPPQAEKWMDLDQYIEDCPFEEFVLACRDWAREASAGDGELLACVYTYCLGQLPFLNCPTDLVISLIKGVAQKLRTLGSLSV